MDMGDRNGMGKPARADEGAGGGQLPGGPITGGIDGKGAAGERYASRDGVGASPV